MATLPENGEEESDLLAPTHGFDKGAGGEGGLIYAPGQLLTACLASGRMAGHSVLHRFSEHPRSAL